MSTDDRIWEEYDRLYETALARKRAEQFMASEDFKKWFHGALKGSVNKAVREFYGMPPERDYSATYEAMAQILMKGVQQQVGTQPRELYRSVTEARTEDLDSQKRIVMAVAATSHVDREGDIITIGRGLDDGVQIRRWWDARAPILWAHNYYVPPIGKAIDWEKKHGTSGKADELRVRIKFLESGSSDLADQVWEALRQEALGAYSIGFRVLDSVPRDQGGRLFQELDLLEISVVPVPANSAALTIAVERGALPSSARQTFVDAFEHLYTEGLFNKKLVPPQIATQVLAHLSAKGWMT